MAPKSEPTANATTSVSEPSITLHPPPSISHLSDRPQQTNDDARGELTAQLEDLLNTLSNKFAGVSSEIFAKSALSS